MIPLILSVVIILSVSTGHCQFPAICNTQENLNTKTCCPNSCGGQARGSCVNLTAEVTGQWDTANSTITGILYNAPNVPEKGTADSRYLWPSVVFENVCQCTGNYGGVDCTECDFGWMGNDCSVKKTLVIRKSFSRLTDLEKENFVSATLRLKNERDVWSVVVTEPTNYTSGTVTLQNISTYDFFVYQHDYVARDAKCKNGTDEGNIIDFAHSGPAFPVWHRRYLLKLEKEFQRIMGNSSFGMPYWQWEEDELSPFDLKYYGIPSNSTGPAVNVTGTVINPETWNAICDAAYTNPDITCSENWKPCNPDKDLLNRSPLQRGGGTTYLPNVIEVMIAIAAPYYDAPNKNGDYLRDDPRGSFRSRLEGWNIICSAANCTGPQDEDLAHMHNNIHDWINGQMDVVPAAVNDPMFNIHHCNVDRILESWMKRFATTTSISLPPYVPVSGGHPGHNQNDYLVPFFPLVTAGDQYKIAEEWGYTYDSLIPAIIPDSKIPDCSTVVSPGSCPICDADTTCINCTSGEVCPAPFTVVLTSGVQESQDNLELSLGLGLGLGIPLLVSIAIILALLVIVIKTKSGAKGKDNNLSLTVRS